MGKSGTRCSYPNGYDYGPRGSLHVTWVWRESSQGANHDLMYAYSQDRGKTWRNNRGEPLPEPPGVASPAVKVVDINRALGLMNTHGQAVDSQGRIHTVMWHCTEQSLRAAGSKPGQHRWGPPEARRYHHYWRHGDAVWQHGDLPMVAGNRPKLFMDEEDNAYLVYCAWCYWWWLNGAASEEGITRDFEEMKRQGISGALLFDAGHRGTAGAARTALHEPRVARDVQARGARSRPLGNRTGREPVQRLELRRGVGHGGTRREEDRRRRPW